MDYIRRTYRVPAQRGGRIVFEDAPGTIVGSHGSYLRVRMDWNNATLTLHPTWMMKYLKGQQA